MVNRVSRWKKPFAAVALATLALAAACASFSSSTTDGDGDASPEAGADAPSVEAAPDAPPQRDAGFDVLCADGGVEFVESFDGIGTPLGWTPMMENATIEPASALPNGVSPPSPPNALYAHGAVPMATSLTARLDRTFSFVPRTAHVAWSMYTPTMTDFGHLGCVLVYSNGTADTRVSTLTGDGALRARHTEPDGGYLPEYVLGALPTSGFVRFGLDVTADVSTGVASAQVTETTPGVATAVGDLGSFALPPKAAIFTLSCGVYYADLGGGSKSQVDVALDDLEVHLCSP